VVSDIPTAFQLESLSPVAAFFTSETSRWRCLSSRFQGRPRLSRMMAAKSSRSLGLRFSLTRSRALDQSDLPTSQTTAHGIARPRVQSVRIRPVTFLLLRRRPLGARPPLCARAPRAAKGTALLARNLLLDDVADKPLQLSVEELRHALLVAPVRPGQLGRVPVPYLLREALDSRVDRNLDVLLAKLLLSVPEVGLGLAGDESAGRPDLAP
jgi:hypothetical protein